MGGGRAYGTSTKGKETVSGWGVNMRWLWGWCRVNIQSPVRTVSDRVST